jgi:hypothetical protein
LPIKRPANSNKGYCPTVSTDFCTKKIIQEKPRPIRFEALGFLTSLTLSFISNLPEFVNILYTNLSFPPISGINYLFIGLGISFEWWFSK